MAGIFFDYTPGQIDVAFKHGYLSCFIDLRIRMADAIVTTTPCDENWKLGKPTDHRENGIEESVCFSAIFCPFKDYIRFLEGVCLQIQECAFSWEAEGPEGRLEWKRRYLDDTGFLTIKWDGCEKWNSSQFSHRMMLNTRQMVRMLYSSFRNFVESTEYDPVRYERMNVGEGFSLILEDCSINDLAKIIVDYDLQRAESLLYQFRKVFSDRQCDGERLVYPLKYYLDASVVPVVLDELNSWINKDWVCWTREQRMTELQKNIFEFEGLGWSGSNLRNLRSTLVEEWLASPEPPRKSPFGIPRQEDD